MTASLGPLIQWIAANGAGVGYQLHTELGGVAETPLATYQDQELSTAHANPIILNANGAISGNIFLLPKMYKFVLKTAVGVPVDTWDNYDGAQGGGDQVASVATYAALTALTASAGLADNGVYCVRGRAAEEDGGFGFWRYDAGSSATANGGTILAHDTSGRFFRLFTGLVHSLWFATGDGSTDDLSALNAFFALAGIYALHIDAGTYNISAVLTTIAAHDVEVSGDGALARIVYVDASATPGNLMSVGDGSVAYKGVSLRGFEIDSTTTLTSGDAVRITSCTEVHVDLVVGDEATYTLNNGVRLDACLLVWMHETRVYPINVGFGVNDSIEIYGMHMFVRGNSSSGTGVILGGGVGGFYAEDMTQLLSGTGLVIDTSLARTTVLSGDTHSNTTIDGISDTSALSAGMAVSGTGIAAGTYIVSVDSGAAITINQNATGTATVSLTFIAVNQQVFLGTSTWDTNINAGINLNDATGNAGISRQLNMDNAWIASTTTGSNIVVSAWRNGLINIPGATIKNATARGIAILDQTISMRIGSGAEISFNTLEGVYSDAAITIYSDALPTDNGGSPFSQTVARESANSISWEQTIADSANASFRNGVDGTAYDGVLKIGNGTTSALFMGSAGSSIEVADPSGAYEASTTPTSATGVAYSGGWKIFNETGVPLTYDCELSKVRAA